MTDIPFAVSDYKRQVSQEPRVLLKNRYFEKNPVLSTTQISLFARPAQKLLTNIDPVNPVRGVYTCPGTFNDSLFVACGLYLYQVDSALKVTNLGQISTSTGGKVIMCATGELSGVSPHLFICDGSILWVYSAVGFAKGFLTADGSPLSSGDQVVVGSYTYQFTSGSVNAGTQNGSAVNPWLVAMGATYTDALTKLYAAINDSGTAGVDYGSLTAKNPNVTAYTLTATHIFVRAIQEGVVGNGYATTTTAAHLSWSSTTLAGGGAPGMVQVATPNDLGVISLGFIESYVIVVPKQGQGVNGRFFWIDPGETTIDPLNFATAERSPDPIYSVVVYGDRFWLPGQTTTEVWLMSGNINAPVQRFQGILFDRGSWEGTAIQVKDSIMIVDNDGGVFQIAGQLKRVSVPDIEERIRRAIAAEASA